MPSNLLQTLKDPCYCILKWCQCACAHNVQITGEFKGDWTQNYGLSLLVFNTSDKIQEVLTFMTPFPQQRRELLKAEE